MDHKHHVITSRRNFLRNSCILSAGVGLIPEWTIGQYKSVNRSSMGIASSSYGHRWRASGSNEAFPGFQDALQMLVHCESIGASGIQVGTKNWSSDFTGKIRDYRESRELYLEGSIKLPQDEADTDRFIQEAKNAKEAGATILRTACLSGRRYENFESEAAFKEFKEHSYQSITRAIPVLEKHRLKLAIENHKDWRVPDLLALLKHFENEWIGVNLDTGNNISFLEDPMQVIEALAPYSFTTHLKDMGVQDYEDGFLLSEVPLGTGRLDLKKVIAVCQQYNPEIKFNLEMITRNPLKVPCFTENYWATFEGLPAGKIAGGVKWVRDHQTTGELPHVDGLSASEKLSFEEENIVSSLKYASEVLKI